jgi:endonuclease/exonuclease/phosphatase family metal-dependent hydrolase
MGNPSAFSSRVTLGSVLVVVAFGLATGCVAPRAYVPPARPDGEELIKVGTFNIRERYGDGRPSDWEQRKHVVIDLIRMEDPDIIGLQEVHESDYRVRSPSVQLSDLKDAFPDYDFVGAGDARVVPANNPIMIRRSRFRRIDDGTLFFSKTPEVPFSVSWAAGRPVYAQWALLTDRESGERLHVINVHYDHLSGPSKRNSSRIVARYLESRTEAELPTIVMGDFNSFRVSVPMSRLRRVGLTDGLRFTRTGSYHMFTGVTPWPRIDHILVSEELHVVDGYISYYRTDEVLPSDHYPVFAFIRPSW